MSIERMRYVMNIVPSTTAKIDQRQQISPNMTFKCDGFITKLTILAQYAADNTLHPKYKYGEVLTALPIRRLVECLLQSL